MTFRELLPIDAWNRAAVAVFLVLWAASSIHVPYPKYFWLQHVPTVAAVLILAVVQNRLQVGRLSYLLILLFLLLHVLGARYLYSYVPYDEWSERLFGVNITNRFGFTRNHYDRFVHLCFGLLLVVPTWRFSLRFVHANVFWSAVFAFSVIMAASAVYEVFEWLVAVVMAPDWAESYNGQQGDPWDAQRDMALAAPGALLGVIGYCRLAPSAGRYYNGFEVTMSDLTHFDATGASRMVDVSHKPVTRRSARASGRVRMSAKTLALVRTKQAAKGDVLEVARLAGIMAAKHTADLIPLCHPLQLESVTVSFSYSDETSLVIEAVVQIEGKTGVEMEALTAVSVAALTVYDMCKSADRGMIIECIQLEEKSGGRSGHWLRPSE